jgi:phosphate transport system protein
VSDVRRGFSEEIDLLHLEVVRMGGIAVEAIRCGGEALVTDDPAAVDRTVQQDSELDRLRDLVEQRIYVLLATQAPVAGDLRALITMLRVTHELERVGADMVNVANTPRRLPPESLDPQLVGILDRMQNQAASQLGLAVDGFAQRDATKVADLPTMDDVMDNLTHELFSTVIAMKSDDAGAVQRAVELALVGRRYERVADHAVNVGEWVDYMVTGNFHEHHREP